MHSGDLSYSAHLSTRRFAGRDTAVLLAILLGGIGLAVVVAIIGLRLLEPQYTAAMVVGPTARSGAAAVGARLPELNREVTASVAEPGAADEVLSDFSRYLALLRGIPVAAQLMADPEVLPMLFPERWDPVGRCWHPATGAWAGLKRGLLALTGRTTPEAPDVVEVAGILVQRVGIATVGTGPMRRISFRHPDRDFALRFLQRLSLAAEQQLRQEAIRRARVQIDLVRRRWETVQSDDHRAALRSLLGEEERLLMVLEADLPYAADVIEPAHAPSLPDWPEALLVIGVSALAALVLMVWQIGQRLSGLRWRVGPRGIWPRAAAPR